MSEERIGIDQLFREHGVFVAGFLRHLGVAPADVDDLVQEVFTVAHRKGGFVVGQASPRTWLAAIATRVASTARRTLRRRREQFSETGTVAPAGPELGPDTALEQRQALDRVATALSELEVHHRAVFVLYELEGESCADIATAIGIPVGTVHSRLHSARRLFQQAYAALVKGEKPHNDERTSLSNEGELR